MGLAGRKVKQRIGADPRNLAWANGVLNRDEIGRNNASYRCLEIWAELPGKIWVGLDSRLGCCRRWPDVAHKSRAEAGHVRNRGSTAARSKRNCLETKQRF